MYVYNEGRQPAVATEKQTDADERKVVTDSGRPDKQEVEEVGL